MQIICINSSMLKARATGIVIISLTIGFSIIGLVWLSRSKPTNTVAEKISVVVTLYPWQYLVEQVGGEYVSVTNIVPAGAEPHDFAPLPQDLVAVYDSDIFIMNGTGIEPWAETLTQADFTAPQHRTLEMTADLNLIATESDNKFDPHIWLDPVIMQTKAETLRDILSELDPGHAADYERNTNAVIADLATLDDNFIDGLNQCSQDTIIVTHDAFTYLGKRYGITMQSILGLNPNSTPSARSLAELSNLAKIKTIDTIFFEALVSSDVANTLADEIGAQTLVLNPLEGLTAEQTTAGENYISIMQNNLEHLRSALHCQK